MFSKYLKKNLIQKNDIINLVEKLSSFYVKLSALVFTILSLTILDTTVNNLNTNNLKSKKHN